LRGQGNRIWILRTQIEGGKVDPSDIAGLLDAEICFFDGTVQANRHWKKTNSDMLGHPQQLGCQENSKCDCRD
jgi:hypothetical protein